MKKLSYNIWVKTIACILCIVSAISIVSFTIGIVVFANLGLNVSSHEDIKNKLYENMSSNYAAKLLNLISQNGEDTELDGMDGGSLSYTVAKTAGAVENVTVNTEYSYIYSNNDNLVTEKNYDYVFSGHEYYSYSYNVSSFIRNVMSPPSVWSRGENKVQNTYYIFLKVDRDKVSPTETFINGDRDFCLAADKLVSVISIYNQYGIMIQILSLLVFIISIVFLTLGAGHRISDEEIHLRWIDKIPYEIYLGVVFILIALGIQGNVSLFIGGLERISLAAFLSFELEITAFWMFIGITIYLSTVTRIKANVFLKNTLIYYVLMSVRKVLGVAKRSVGNIVKTVHENISLFWKTVGILVVVSSLEFILLIGFSKYIIVPLFILYKIAETAVIIWALLQLNRIKEGGQRISQGDYNHPINTEGMYWDFKEHAENINHVGDGISIAVDERMKSEHFKTELITNVSHDIKTPLTSIINYVNLIKKENVASETVNEYLDVIDRQSAKLKKLIEDLMDASKASTGNMPVALERCDANVMLTQIIGEFEEKMAENHLELIVTETKQPVIIMADGRHLWRVFDNLMNNVNKYAQPGTRVYIDLKKKDNQIEIIFRNTSKYRLNITSDELMERFVRGDSSRNTEGHGLGLSIAQSLTSLMNGALRVNVDGDLFKVVLSFPEIK